MLLDELLQRDTHLLLDDAWVVHVAADTEQFGALVSLPSKGREPAPTSPADCRRDSYRLHICNGRRTAEETDVSRERRLQTRLALLSLNTLNQRRLLSTDVRARAAMEVHIKAVSAPTRVLAEEARFVRLIDRLLDMRGFLVKLATDVDVGRRRVHAATGDKAALDEFMRVAPENLAVFAGSRFAFVGVDNEVARSRVNIREWESKQGGGILIECPCLGR